MESQQQGGNLAGFDAKQERKAAADVLPAGEYDLVVASCKMAKTTNGDYQQIALELKVLNGEYQNRTVFQNLMFEWTGKGAKTKNAETALRMGRSTFAKICEAVGVNSPKDTNDLVGKSFLAKLNLKENDEFGDKNNITKAKPRTTGGTSPAAPAAGGKW